NLIGTDVTGKFALGNGTGVEFGKGFHMHLGECAGYASGKFLGELRSGNGNVLESGGNVISGNFDEGVRILKGAGNVVRNDYIGVGLDGITPIANLDDGVVIEDGEANVIGG